MFEESYECKASALDRPYLSRPSRTQQLLNPRLKPRLNSDTPNELLKRQGVADEELAKAQNARDAIAQSKEHTVEGNTTEQPSSRRSRSPSSANSISTISTSRSGSRDRHGEKSRTKPRKRSHEEMSPSRSPQRSVRPEQHKSRRYRSRSPHGRGRSYQRDDRRSTSRSSSQDRSIVNKNRRSLDDDAGSDSEARLSDRTNRRAPRQNFGTATVSKGVTQYGGRQQSASKRDRSLSPYSRRLALTQAMNSGR